MKWNLEEENKEWKDEGEVRIMRDDKLRLRKEWTLHTSIKLVIKGLGARLDMNLKGRMKGMKRNGTETWMMTHEVKERHERVGCKRVTDHKNDRLVDGLNDIELGGRKQGVWKRVEDRDIKGNRLRLRKAWTLHTSYLKTTYKKGLVDRLDDMKLEGRQQGIRRKGKGQKHERHQTKVKKSTGTVVGNWMRDRKNDTQECVKITASEGQEVGTRGYQESKCQGRIAKVPLTPQDQCRALLSWQWAWEIPCWCGGTGTGWRCMSWPAGGGREGMVRQVKKSID